jgi:hypothetical protein
MTISWSDIASLATAAGTLVLAVATFGSVKSANRAARAAERSLLAGLRPVLIPSREDDLVERVRFGDGYVSVVSGHGGSAAEKNERLYLALSLRNGGAGLAVLHAWRVDVRERTDSVPPPLEEFRRQQRDIYIPAADVGFWQGAIRDRSDGSYERVRDAIRVGDRLMIDLMYGDHEGGQRTIARFALSRVHHEGADENEHGAVSVGGAAAGGGAAADNGGPAYRAEVVRYWNVDEADPR